MFRIDSEVTIVSDDNIILVDGKESDDKLHECPNCGHQMIPQGGRECYMCQQCNYSKGHCSV